MNKKQLMKKDKDLLYSLALGDGCIYGNANRNFYQLSIGHGEKQKDYCKWKMDLLNESNIFIKKIKLHRQEINDKNRNRIWVQYNFKKASVLLKELWEDYHSPDRINRILENIHSDRSLAIWFMDDGATEKHKKKHKDGTVYWSRPSFHLCTHCFSEQENIIIAEWFKKRYQVDAYVCHDNRKNTSYSYLRFSTDSTEKIYKIIRPYVLLVDSMKDKFSYIENYYYSNT